MNLYPPPEVLYLISPVFFIRSVWIFIKSGGLTKEFKTSIIPLMIMFFGLPAISTNIDNVFGAYSSWCLMMSLTTIVFMAILNSMLFILKGLVNVVVINKFLWLITTVGVVVSVVLALFFNKLSVGADILNTTSVILLCVWVMVSLYGAITEKGSFHRARWVCALCLAFVSGSFFVWRIYAISPSGQLNNEFFDLWIYIPISVLTCIWAIMYAPTSWVMELRYPSRIARKAYRYLLLNLLTIWLKRKFIESKSLVSNSNTQSNYGKLIFIIDLLRHINSDDKLVKMLKSVNENDEQFLLIHNYTLMFEQWFKLIIIRNDSFIQNT